MGTLGPAASLTAQGYTGQTLWFFLAVQFPAHTAQCHHTGAACVLSYGGKDPGWHASGRHSAGAMVSRDYWFSNKTSGGRGSGGATRPCNRQRKTMKGQSQVTTPFCLHSSLTFKVLHDYA